MSKRWTLLVIGDDQTAVRQVKLTRELIRGIIATALILFSVLTTGAAQLMLKLQGPRQVARLAAENDELRAELDSISGQVETLETVLDQLARQDEQFRLVAGLEPLSEDVRRAGIGGPGADQATGTGGDISTLLRRARLLAASWTEARDTLSAKHDRLASTPSILPTEGVITSAFARWRVHPILNRARPHQGLDITARQGTPIVAAAKGRVRFVGYSGEYGLMVEIDHGYGYVTRYAHAARTHVRTGESVQRGDTIARVGSTGLSVGPHLHYEVLLNGQPVNPRKFVLELNAIPD